MAARKKWVVFHSNVTVPAEVLGEDEDRKFQTGMSAQLPAGYADHVVHDGLARYSDGAGKRMPRKAATAEHKATLQAKDERIAGLEAALEAATSELQALNRAAAQARVDDLTARMSEMAETDDGWEALSAALDEAVAARAALEPAR